MIDFTQWVETVNATSTGILSDWDWGAAVVLFMVGVALLLLLSFWIGRTFGDVWVSCFFALILLAVYCVFIFADVHKDTGHEKLATSIERTFDITVTGWNKQEETFQQNDSWPENDTYDITYINNETQRVVDGKLIVQGHSIGVVDADGAFLEGEYK